MSNTSSFNPLVAGLILPDRFQELGPGTPDSLMLAHLQPLTPNCLFPGQSIAQPQMAACCLSGLWLYYDFLDRSHELSQNIPTPEGSYWHAIMHRREGDFSNSKYWIARVGDHPVYALLAQEASAIARHYTLGPQARFLSSSNWQPKTFVDLCQLAIGGQTDLVEPCRKIQQAEWNLLFRYCYDQALGPPR